MDNPFPHEFWLCMVKRYMVTLQFWCCLDVFGSMRALDQIRADEASPSIGVLGLVCGAFAAVPVIKFCFPRPEKKKHKVVL